MFSFSTQFSVVPVQLVMPEPLIAGDTWSFKLLTTCYAGQTAVLNFAAGSTKLASTAVEEGEYFVWTIPGSQTAPLATSVSLPYLYTVTVSDGSGNRYTIDTGSALVAPDISVTTIPQTQTNLQQMLAACDKTLIALLSGKTTMVQFAGQMYQFHELDKLYKVREALAIRVADEADRLRGAARYRQVVCTFREY